MKSLLLWRCVYCFKMFLLLGIHVQAFSTARIFLLFVTLFSWDIHIYVPVQIHEIAWMPCKVGICVRTLNTVLICIHAPTKKGIMQKPNFHRYAGMAHTSKSFRGTHANTNFAWRWCIYELNYPFIWKTILAEIILITIQLYFFPPFLNILIIPI